MASILLLGSDRERAMSVRSLLRQDGHQVTYERNLDGWRDRERRIQPHLIVAAVESAESVLATSSGTLRGFPAPILFVQHETDFCRDVHLDERLIDRITSPFLEQDLLGRVDALVRVRSVIHGNSVQSTGAAGADEGQPDAGGWKGQLQRLRALLGSRIPPHKKSLGPYLEVAAQVADWTDRRDAFARGHAERVASISAMIGEGLRIDADETGLLLRAAALHDIGKVGLPQEILHQKTPLQENQIRLIRTHPRRGAALLKALDQDEEVAETILYHHERPDGSGYYGMQADSIPRTARILAVAEVYDAMTSSRLREPTSSQDALKMLKARRGQDFDPDCVDALVDRMKPRRDVLPLSDRPTYS